MLTLDKGNIEIHLLGFNRVGYGSLQKLLQILSGVLLNRKRPLTGITETFQTIKVIIPTLPSRLLYVYSLYSSLHIINIVLAVHPFILSNVSELK